MCRENQQAFVLTIMFNTNMLSGQKRKVKKFYTSSVGVYSPAEIFNEDDGWKPFLKMINMRGGRREWRTTSRCLQNSIQRMLLFNR